MYKNTCSFWVLNWDFANKDNISWKKLTEKSRNSVNKAEILWIKLMLKKRWNFKILRQDLKSQNKKNATNHCKLVFVQLSIFIDVT